jgi:hypothetical protein
MTHRLLIALALLAPACCPVSTSPECPEIEPADLASASAAQTDRGFCGELADGALAYCWIDNRDAADGAPACYVDGWACQAVALADGSTLSRLDLHGPMVDGTLVATGVGYLADGSTCVAAYDLTID